MRTAKIAADERTWSLSIFLLIGEFGSSSETKAAQMRFIGIIFRDAKTFQLGGDQVESHRNFICACRLMKLTLLAATVMSSANGQNVTATMAAGTYPLSVAVDPLQTRSTSRTKPAAT